MAEHLTVNAGFRYYDDGDNAATGVNWNTGYNQNWDQLDKIAGDGLDWDTSSPKKLAVQVDNSTIEISGDRLRLKGGLPLSEHLYIDSLGNFGFNQTTFGGSAEKVLAIGSGTAPSSSPADCVQLWSADRGGIAGKAGLHVLSEDGAGHVFGDRVGLFTTTPSYSLEIAKTISIASTSDRLINIAGIFDGTLTGNRTSTGVYLTTTNNAVLNGYSHSDIGLFVSCINPESYLLSTMYSISCSSILNHTSGTVNEAYGVFSQVTMDGSGGTLNSAYGFRTTVVQNAGTIGTGYGVFIGTIAGTFGWGLYQNGATNNNYFAGSILIGGTGILGTSATRTLAIKNGVAPASSPVDTVQLYSNDQAAGNACLHIRTENGAIIKLFQEAALTTALTTITYTAPGTPDYAIQNLTNSGGYGFVTRDEGNTVLAVIANLQTRVNELETRLKAHGLLA